MFSLAFSGVLRYQRHLLHQGAAWLRARVCVCYVCASVHVQVCLTRKQKYPGRSRLCNRRNGFKGQTHTRAKVTETLFTSLSSTKRCGGTTSAPCPMKFPRDGLEKPPGMGLAPREPIHVPRPPLLPRTAERRRQLGLALRCAKVSHGLRAAEATPEGRSRALKTGGWDERPLQTVPACSLVSR